YRDARTMALAARTARSRKESIVRALLHLSSDLHSTMLQRGLDTFDAIFNLAGGDVISGHQARNVALFELGRWSGFMKRDVYVPWKEFLSDWCDGFGWVSKSTREWQTLHGVRAMGIDAPEPLGYGECDGQAFLIVRRLREHVCLVEHFENLSDAG